MFLKKGVLKSFCNIHRKTSVLESLNKVAGLKASKETPTQVLSREYCEIFRNTSFIEHLRWLPLLFYNIRKFPSKKSVAEA